ncbi:NADP-dependent oxidoreductase [Mycolicibacterium vaccae]|uniref:NADP-dependent oxidoreductase n=1 Tax=Mycolicibacterium vaccae TaxID=1810 RepID=UPI003CEE07B8
MSTPTSAAKTNTAWYLTSRPSGLVDRRHFDVRSTPLPPLGPGDVLVRNIYLMVPASMRLWMNAGDSYLPEQPLDEVMRGITVGVVEKSNAAHLPVGTFVTGMGGWQQYSVSRAGAWAVIERHPDIALTAYLGPLGLQGLTAYCGLTDVGQPVAGETLVVTAAAGSVGSLVCQIGKKLGLRVVGIAGGPDKCAWLREKCGVDGAIDYRGEDVAARLDALCPDGIDVAFENVGGPVLDLILERINMHARIALCGLVSSYHGAEQTAGRALMKLVNQRGLMRGFIVTDYLGEAAQVRDILTPWILDGTLVHREEFSSGLDSAPEAMNRVSRGENLGLQFVRV